MNRLFRDYTQLDGSKPKFGAISGGKHGKDPWQADLWILTDWMELPNIASVELHDSFDQDGVAEPTAATIQVENVVYKQMTGPGGPFRQFLRGFLSPWRGLKLAGRPAPTVDQNEWYEMLFTSGTQIEIKQGYGNSLTRTWTGLIDETNVQSSPDTITLTARNFGVMFTEQRLFGWNKARDVPSPVVFSDTLKADDVEPKASAAKASSSHPPYVPSTVLDSKNSTFWLSGGHPNPNFTEYVEVKVPRGRYETAFLHPRYPGMETYLSIYARSNGLGGKSCKVNGHDIPDGWINRGGGRVPGANGGHPFARKWAAINDGPQSKHFGFTLECGDNTTLRFSFRNLGWSTNFNDYRASVTRLYGARRKRKVDAKKQHWVLVNDLADVVRWVCMWAGFKEWEIENTGVTLQDTMVFHQGDYMIDVIRHCVQQGNFVFFIKKPTDDDRSMGVPVFRRSRALLGSPVEEVRDTDLLTGLQGKFTVNMLAQIIRFRGKPPETSKQKRPAARYWPPWSGSHHDVATGVYDHETRGLVGRTGGVYRHESHEDQGLETNDECMMACLLTALQMALAAFQGVVEIPGFPGVELDDQVSVLDQASAFNTRLWVSSRSSTFTRGDQTEWKTSLTGALLDTPDVKVVGQDYLELLARVAHS